MQLFHACLKNPCDVISSSLCEEDWNNSDNILFNYLVIDDSENPFFDNLVKENDFSLTEDFFSFVLIVWFPRL